MQPILADILELAQHLIHLDQQPKAYKPDSCVCCGLPGLWCHGHYPRKSDRESPASETLNPMCPSGKRASNDSKLLLVMNQPSCWAIC